MDSAGSQHPMESLEHEHGEGQRTPLLGDANGKSVSRWAGWGTATLLIWNPDCRKQLRGGGGEKSMDGKEKGCAHACAHTPWHKASLFKVSWPPSAWERYGSDGVGWDVAVSDPSWDLPGSSRGPPLFHLNPTSHNTRQDCRARNGTRGGGS